LQVLVVGLEGDAVEVEVFEGVAELEELGLGVDSGALDGWAEPGMADLDGSVAEVEVKKAR